MTKHRNDVALGIAIAWAHEDPCCEDIAVRGMQRRDPEILVWDQDRGAWRSAGRVDRGEVIR